MSPLKNSRSVFRAGLLRLAMKSQGRIPYRKVGHLLRFDFDEIVEWTKDKEK
jgi:hypothetical protein